MSPDTQTKRCPHCGESKPLSGFSPITARPGRVQSWCRVCFNARTAAYMRTRRAENSAYNKRYLAEHPGLGATYARNWRAANPERAREIARQSYARRAEQRRAEQRRADARAQYAKQRATAEKVEAMRVRKIDARGRRAALAGKPDAETVAYMAILRNDPCTYCGAARGGTVDHIEPLVAGGAHHWSNLTAACERCNKSKKTRNLVGFLVFRQRLAHAAMEVSA